MRTYPPFFRVFIATSICFLYSRGAFAQSFAAYVTTPMDTSDLAWMEQGLNPDAPTNGLPHAGTINGLTDPSSTFLLQPYTGNNVFFLSRNQNLIGSNPPPPQQLTGTITFANPTPALSLAFAGDSTNGASDNVLTIHFSDGTPDATVMLNVDDWAGTAPGSNPGIVATSIGRVVVHPSPGFEFLPGNFSIWEDVVQLPETAPHPISSIDVALGNHRLAIFGVSTSLLAAGPYTAAELTPSSFNQDLVVEASAAVPEPAVTGSLFVAGLTVLAGRRR